MNNRDVQEIRKNIAKRKKYKRENVTGSDTPRSISFVQDEEKHGFLPFLQGDSTSSMKRSKARVHSFILKLLLACILFFGTAILFRLDGPVFQKTQAIALNALTEEFPFAKVQAWYRDYFGAPLAIIDTPPSNEVAEGTNYDFILPVMGNISETFQQNGKGIFIETDGKTNVSAMDNGTVIFAGNKNDTGKTVIIQHDDGSESTYGNLTNIKVYHYQFVTSNQVIGEIVQEDESVARLYFSIQKDRQYIDPVKVMQVDDQP
ncbi:M23 family metallopeptidase [Salirhabdus salicampi]|uniref:M23 family metallopeptidase n=1 Tax=Salirhabdus salicampi TaxID=476102 RepID=UPI0020C4B062|nr:M23 family metallopeptidase [Salirhabdus salicampi]MCP8617008.1 M23 family metallopeptidase [Salirhabdus salicampi]